MTETSVSGLVINKSMGFPTSYYLLTGEGYCVVSQSNLAKPSDLPINSLARVSGSLKNNVLHASEIQEISDEKLGRAIGNLVEKNCAPLKKQLLVDHAIARGLEKDFASAARLIAESVFTLTPLLVRYDDDADGITSAVELKQGIFDFIARHEIPFPHSFIKFAKDEAIYELKTAQEDCLWADAFAKKPLLVLLDHGANTESIPALAQAKSCFDIIIVDHHPPNFEAAALAVLFISPFTKDSSVIASSFCTGLLSYEISSRIGNVDETLAWIAMYADHSRFRKGEWPQVLALEFVQDSKKNPAFEEFENVLSGKGFELAFKKAVAKIRLVLQESSHYTKIHSAGNAFIQVINLSKLVKKNSFPSKSRTINELHRAFEEKHAGLACVTLGYADNSLSFRASDAANALGFKANALIAQLKESHSYAITSGGGHEQAASMRFKSEFRETILETTLNEVKKWFENKS